MSKDIKQFNGKVDFGIITIREDEFEAILQRFPPECSIEGRRRYGITRLALSDKEEYVIALVRCPEQGTGEGQSVARDLIEDFDPQWLILVGIAGGIPADEYSLGDVIVASRLHDFTITAHLENATGNKEEFGLMGGPMHRQVQDLLAYLPAMASHLGDWNSETAIGRSTPPVKFNAQNFYGDEGWKKKVRASLKRNFGQEIRRPKVTTGAIASSDRLVKETKTIKEWQQGARQITAVEMELAGIYRAARQKEKEYPILAIRGISDIVGFKRHSDWTSYACQTAASFALALLKTRPISPRSLHAEAPSTNANPQESVHTDCLPPLNTPKAVAKQESLISNLLAINKIPDIYYAAPTDYIDRKEVWYALDALGIQPKTDWIIKSNTIYSFRNLNEHPWNQIITSPASAEPTKPWGTTSDQARGNNFVELLNRCLIQKGEESDLVYHRKFNLLYFAPTPETIVRTIVTQSFKRSSSHQVVSSYGSVPNPTETNPTGTKPRYYRHHAFTWQFIRIEGHWYLEITPTYYYTSDGTRLYGNYENLLKGIKRIEMNAAVGGQVLMWADYLHEHGGMFAIQKYPYLEFGSLKEFKVDFGINDSEWEGKESYQNPDQQSFLAE